MGLSELLAKAKEKTGVEVTPWEVRVLMRLTAQGEAKRLSLIPERSTRPGCHPAYRYEAVVQGRTIRYVAAKSMTTGRYFLVAIHDNRGGGDDAHE